MRSTGRVLLLAVVLACVMLPRPAPAADATVRIYTSTLNEFATALSPIPPITGNYRLQSCFEFFGRHCITLCDSPYSAMVSGLNFAISPSAVTATGSVSAQWCNISFGGSLNASGNVFYTAADSKVRFNFTSAAVQPSFNFLGLITVWLPFSINIAPTLNIPSMTIGSAWLGYESASGPRQLVMRPSDSSLFKRSGYLELQTNLIFY